MNCLFCNEFMHQHDVGIRECDKHYYKPIYYLDPRSGTSNDINDIQIIILYIDQFKLYIDGYGLQVFDLGFNLMFEYVSNPNLDSLLETIKQFSITYESILSLVDKLKKLNAFY